MRSRLAYENELFDLLEGVGYRCLRSAGSRGPADLLAVSALWVRVIQVKSTLSFDRKGNPSVFKKAIKDLQMIPCPPNCTRELWVRVLRKGWRYVVIDDFPLDDEGIRDSLKNATWLEPEFARLPSAREVA